MDGILNGSLAFHHIWAWMRDAMVLASVIPLIPHQSLYELAVAEGIIKR